MVKSALQKISTLAKQIRKKHPKKEWKACIKAASVIYKKAKTRQTGASSKKHDVALKAKAPGRRKSKTGKIYYERRKNRSDKPGTLQGVTTGQMERLQKEVREKSKALTQIDRLKSKLKDKGLTSAEKAEIKKAITYYLKIIKASTKHIANLKKFI
jgi:hypothetical protein